MIIHKHFLLLLLTLLLIPTTAFAQLNVFACAPEWGALAEEIGGHQVSVYVASNAAQDIHHLRAKPSFLAKMRKADLVFCTGASLESGWLPVLLQKAGDPKVQPGQIGHLIASNYVIRLEVLEAADRSMGDVHSEGNPHIHLNPHNLILIADELSKRLAKLSPESKNVFNKNYEDFRNRWLSNIDRWEKQTLPLRNKNVVVYHSNWVYLLEWLKLNRIATLEPVPGIPPRISHLETVLTSIQDQHINAILLTPYQQNKAAAWLSKRSDIPVIVLPYTVGGNEKAKDLESLFEETIRMLLETSAGTGT